MKVSIVGEDKKWMHKYPINIYDVKFELIHWYATSHELWNAVTRCLIGKTGIYLYLFSDITFLKYADTGDVKYKLRIMINSPRSPSECHQLLSKEAEEDDSDLYSTKYLKNFNKTSNMATHT